MLVMFAVFLVLPAGLWIGGYTYLGAEFMVFVFDGWTGGEDGLTGLTRSLPVLRDNLVFYYFVYGFFVVSTIVLWRIVHSPFGQVLQAIKQSETRARALGYDTARYQWAV